jgi:hypothetical protein
MLAAVHQAADTTCMIATEDHKAVVAAADENRLYVPVRLLSDKYDIPHPYTPAPRPHVDALLAAYDSTTTATTRIAAALDNIATAVNAPSSVLTAARKAITTTCPGQPRYVRRPSTHQAHSMDAIPLPGPTQHALLKLQIRDQTLLLRAAVIDQTARELVTEATTKAHRAAAASLASRIDTYKAGSFGRP